MKQILNELRIAIKTCADHIIDNEWARFPSPFECIVNPNLLFINKEEEEVEEEEPDLIIKVV